MNHTWMFTPIYENDIYLFILDSDFCLLTSVFSIFTVNLLLQLPIYFNMKRKS